MDLCVDLSTSAQEKRRCLRVASSRRVVQRCLAVGRANFHQARGASTPMRGQQPAQVV